MSSTATVTDEPADEDEQSRIEERTERWKRRARRLRSEVSWYLVRGIAYGTGTAAAGVAILWARQHYGG